MSRSHQHHLLRNLSSATHEPDQPHMLYNVSGAPRYPEHYFKPDKVQFPLESDLQDFNLEQPFNPILSSYDKTVQLKCNQACLCCSSYDRLSYPHQNIDERSDHTPTLNIAYMSNKNAPQFVTNDHSQSLDYSISPPGLHHRNAQISFTKKHRSPAKLAPNVNSSSYVVEIESKTMTGSKHRDTSEESFSDLRKNEKN